MPEEACGQRGVDGRQCDLPKGHDGECGVTMEEAHVQEAAALSDFLHDG